jgi:huntingtin
LVKPYQTTQCKRESASDSLFVKQDRFEFEDEAVEAVQKGRAWGALYFSPNYSHSLRERIEDARSASELTVDQSNVMVQMDMSSE